MNFGLKGDFVMYEFEGKKPKIGKETYVSKSADVIGDVRIGGGCYIGPGAKIKGDYGAVVIGSFTSVQENCILHARPSEELVVGDWVTVGHGSILHNCCVKDYAVIGMGAIVSDYAEIGVWGVVGEGCVVKQEQKIGDSEIAVGVPAKIVGKINENYKKEWIRFKEIYVELAKRYEVGLKKV